MGKKLNLNSILRELRAERDRIDRAIASLERLAAHRAGHVSSVGAPARRGRKFMSGEERKQVSERMKKYWRSRR
jgi:hypothetical protein